MLRRIKTTTRRGGWLSLGRSLSTKYACPKWLVAGVKGGGSLGEDGWDGGKDEMRTKLIVNLYAPVQC